MTPPQTFKSTVSSFTRDKRDWLFKKSRPEIRKYDHEKDKGFLWAAYKHGSFDLAKDLAQEDFLVELARKFPHPILWVVEDFHSGFKSGRGIIALIAIKTDGWVFEPSVMFFKWATKSHVLRASVSFFHLMRNKSPGVCLVRTLEKDFAYMKHMEKYGVLYLRGKIPAGSPLGHVFIFSIEGKK